MSDCVIYQPTEVSLTFYNRISHVKVSLMLETMTFRKCADNFGMLIADFYDVKECANVFEKARSFLYCQYNSDNTLSKMTSDYCGTNVMLHIEVQPKRIKL